MGCINKQSLEYEDLKRSSTLSEKILDTKCLVFLNQHNRLPRLDEITGSQSSKYLNEALKVNLYKGVLNQKLFEFTGTNSVSDAVININNQFLDILMRALDLGESSIVDIQLRPDVSYKEIDLIYTPNEDVSSEVIIAGLNDLRELYGYNIIETNNYELEESTMGSAKAFIKDGNIYVNTDNMTSDSMVHEMLHLLVGSIRFKDPNLYLSLLELASKIKNIETLMEMLYPDKTQNDALEEILVTELAQKLMGVPSRLDSLSNEQLYEINYNVKRVLDTLLFGDYSTKIIKDRDLYNMTLRDVALVVNSSKLTSDFKGTAYLDGSVIHRKLSNMKSDLLRKHDLLKLCD